MTKRIDHLVIVNDDLDALAAVYKALGFQVGGRNRHDWGTLNHIAQFDGAFLELLSTEEGYVHPPEDAPVAPFSYQITQDLDAGRAGVSMLVLSSDDAAADHKAWSAEGYAAPKTLYFERTGQGAGGVPTKVAFSLAFAASPAVPGAGFFVCQQHHPENFWFADRQVHENGVTGIAQVTLVAADQAGAADFVASYSGVAGTARAGWTGQAFETAAGRVQLATPDDAATHYPEGALSPMHASGGFVAVHFGTADMRQTQAALDAGSVRYRVADSRIIVDASDALGVCLIFEPRARA